MAEIFIKKIGSDSAAGNYVGFDYGKLVIDFRTEECFLEVEKQHKDSTDEVITTKGYVRHRLPDAAYNYLLTAAKITKLTEYGTDLVNAPEPEPEPEA